MTDQHDPDLPTSPLDATPPSHEPRRPAARRGSTAASPAVAADDWTAEDEERYQEQRSRESTRQRIRRRQGWSFVAIVALVVLIGLLGAAVHQGYVSLPFGSGSKAAVPCPAPSGPAKPGDTSVNVLNASGKKGLAGTVSKDLAARGYNIASVGNAPDASRNFPDPAHIVHGPDGLTAAQSVQAQVPGAVLVADQRADATVDLLLGGAYTALAAPEAATKALAPAPVKSPQGCVQPTS